MSIDISNFPGDTVVRCNGRHHVVGWMCEPDVMYVPVPDGMSVEDATQALADHVQWVPLPDGPTKAHVGARLRCLIQDGPSLSGVMAYRSDDGFPSAGFVGGWGAEVGEGREWFIHPDDVPTDPDADLIEDMARSIRDDADRGSDMQLPFFQLERKVQDRYRDAARAALAVVREHEAGTR